MKRIELYIMPYAKENEVQTYMVVDGNKIFSRDNRMANLVVYKPMRKWLNPYKKKLFVWNGLLAEIIEEFNDKTIQFIFHGCKTDYILFKKCILVQQKKLNRNEGPVEVSFDIIDSWNPRKTEKKLVDILDDLRVEADNWGKDSIIKTIDQLKSEACNCKVTLKTEYGFPSEFQNLLQKNHIGIKKDAALIVIPIDGNVSASDFCDFMTLLITENDGDRKYIVVNTATQENEKLFDTIISYNNQCDENIIYVENDGGNYIKEIEKLYYLFMLPRLIKKTTEILVEFPDHDTNNFLLDISDKIEDLFYVRL